MSFWAKTQNQDLCLWDADNAPDNVRPKTMLLENDKKNLGGGQNLIKIFESKNFAIVLVNSKRVSKTLLCAKKKFFAIVLSKA